MSEQRTAADVQEESASQIIYIERAPITVRDLAVAVDRSPIDLLKILMQYGLMVPITQSIDFDTATLVCSDLGIEILAIEEEPETPPGPGPDGSEPGPEPPGPDGRSRIQKVIDAEAADRLQRRPLVATVLGHVDHGKTTLLDAIRSTNVVNSEAGGITQSIGAYQVQHESDGHPERLTFIDTPGHQAFTQMRARGAEVTDLVILVVAADDGIMPQTQEAIDHARAAKVPMVVAMNKIDRPNANVDNVKNQLAGAELVPSDWGGDIHVIPISALMGDNLEELLDTVTLMTDDIDPKANPKGKTVGTVLEAHVDPKSGITATLLVQNGTLKQGDHVVAGQTWGRIKAMRTYDGASIKQAAPSTPVQILGLNEPPAAGDFFEVVKTKKMALRQVAENQDRAQTLQDAEAPTATSLEDIFSQLAMQSAEDKKLEIIVRADVQGSLDPVLSSLEALPQTEVKLHILRGAVGNISETDVMLAETTPAPTVILGFNVSVESTAEKRIQASGIDVRLYKVIYELIEDVELALEGMLSPSYEEVVIGQAEVREQFAVKGGFAAGCIVIDGMVKQNAQARLLRPGSAERLTRIAELRHYRDQVDTVQMGQECGIRLSDINDFLSGDLIEVFEQQEQVRTR